jgi:hypothetical protein
MAELQLTTEDVTRAVPMSSKILGSEKRHTLIQIVTFLCMPATAASQKKKHQSPRLPLLHELKSHPPQTSFGTSSDDGIEGVNICM